ncbi:MAG: hypothetical protein CXT73_07155 [Methanobacteriota archaeon]|jgi:hypothetical protein|nr:MAG: hypothetical protein CXT73_07155 [Euryarchaeota archaeon]
MEFDRSIKKNNVKFDFVKGNNINKQKKNKKEDKKDKDDNSDVKEGFGSNVREGFVNKNIFKFETNTFNFWVYLIIIFFVPVIGINGILLFHRYASFKEMSWNGIARSKDESDEIVYASNIYNDNGEYTKKKGDITYKNDNRKMKFDKNSEGNQKHYNNENECNKYSNYCRNWYATNKNKHINPIFNYLPTMKVEEHIKNKYTEDPEKDYTWGVGKGFTHELSDTFDFYRGLIKTFIEFIIPGKQSFDGMNSKLGQHLREKVEHLRDPEKVKNPTISLDGFGKDSLFKLFIFGIIFFVIGLLLSCVAPVLSLIFGSQRFLSDGSGYGSLGFIKAPRNFLGEIIGLIGANLVSCLMPLYFLFYALFFPFINTGDGNKPSYWDEFKCILTSGSSLIPSMVISFFLIMTTIFIEVNTALPSGSVLGGGALAIFFIMGIGFARIHS